MLGTSFGIGRSLFMLMLGLTFIASITAPTTAWAEEEAEVPPAVSVSGEMTVEWHFDKEALATAIEGAEADDEGSKSATVTGKVVMTAPDGSSTSTNANFSQSIDAEGVTSDVTYAVLDIDYPTDSSEVSIELFTVNNLWVMIAGMLVFIMHLGFAMVESGLTRAKNTVNILFKNVMIVMIGIVTYGTCGWLIMYPGDSWIVSDIFAFGFGIGEGAYGDGLAIDNHNQNYYEGRYTMWTDFFFQAMFAATCCTIVSGAVAGRVKLLPFLIFCALFSGLLYPMTGSWDWGGGWLDDLGFADFAGSTLVHAVGAAGALACALLLGPRIGKYAKDGSVQPIPGHSMPLATIGVFLLWFGWFGFNGGSELSANPAGVSYVLVTTTFAACGGGLAAATVSWIAGGKPDLSMTLNGILAGLVGITAGPDMPSWIGALLICGVVPGILVYFSVLFFDKIKIDDPVGAISVHGVCGIYGTLAVAFSGAFEGNFGNLGVQALGTFTIFGTALLFAFAVFGTLKVTMGIRVSEAEELEGLDLGEHDMSAYPDFQQTYIKSYHAGEI